VDFGRVILSSVDKIEIVTDAGSLSYGQDASGGVILITTRELDSTTGRVRAWAGNLGVFFSEVDATVSRGAWGIGLRGGYERSDGFKVNNDREKHRVGMSVAWRGEELRTVLAADHQTEEQGFSGLPAFPTPHSRQKNRNFNMNLAVDFRSFKGSATLFEGRSENLDPSRNMFQTLRITKGGTDLRYGASLGPMGLDLGTGYEETRAQSSDFGTRRENIFHLFGGLKYPLPWIPVELTFGLRANLNSGFDDSFCPEAGLIFRTGYFEAGYRYSRAANTPSFQQRFSRSSSTNPNPSLGIETADNHSLNLAIVPFDDLSLHLTAYHNTLKGRITYVRAANSAMGRYENLGRARFTGVDLGFDWAIASWVKVKGNVSLIKARDLDLEKDLPSQPKIRSRFEVTLRPLDGLTIVGSLDHSGPNFTDRENTNKLAGRVLTGLRAEYNIGRYSFFIDSQNLLDCDYYYVDGLVAPPMTWFAGMGVSF
jgi:iron complex outermembrane receptor protein